MTSRITNHDAESSDINPDNAAEDLLNYFENDDKKEEASANEPDKTSEDLDDPVEDGETSEKVDASVNEFFERVSKMNIKDITRSGYNASNRLFLLWLDEKHPPSSQSFS